MAQSVGKEAIRVSPDPGDSPCRPVMLTLLVFCAVPGGL